METFDLAAAHAAHFQSAAAAWGMKKARMGKKFRLEIPLSSSSDCNVAMENAFY